MTLASVLISREWKKCINIIFFNYEWNQLRVLRYVKTTLHIDAFVCRSIDGNCLGWWPPSPIPPIKVMVIPHSVNTISLRCNEVVPGVWFDCVTVSKRQEQTIMNANENECIKYRFTSRWRQYVTGKSTGCLTFNIKHLLMHWYSLINGILGGVPVSLY